MGSSLRHPLGEYENASPVQRLPQNSLAEGPIFSPRVSLGGICRKSSLRSEILSSVAHMKSRFRKGAIVSPAFRCGRRCPFAGERWLNGSRLQGSSFPQPSYSLDRRTPRLRSGNRRESNIGPDDESPRKRPHREFQRCARD